MAQEDVLERSRILLRSALDSSPHGGFLQSSPHGGYMSRKSDYRRSDLSRRSDIINNLSLTMSPLEISKIKKGDVNLSITLAPGEISQVYDITEVRTLVKNRVQDSLYQLFQESTELHGSTHGVFEAISNFIEACSVTIESVSSSKGLTDKDGNDLTWLVNERNTWRLVYGLYKDRLTNQDDDENSVPEFIDPISEKEVVMNYYKREKSVRECQIIIDWLEKISGDEWNVLSRPKVGHFTDRTVAWENTLHQLQNSTVAYMSSRDTVSCLDPDAPLREQKPLHDLDIEDEERLLDQVFFEIRRGNLKQAQEICAHCGQAWRAATLEGWRLHHDPNYRLEKQTTEKLPVEGNPNRDIWKLCAWNLCEDMRAHPKARAIMGALCGHLDSLLAVCTGWEDLLWAYLRVMVDRRVERVIRENSPRDYIPMPEQYNNLTLNLDEVFREVKANDLACEESQKPDRVIQEMLTLDNEAQLLIKMSEWIEVECDAQFLRFLAHLVIILRLVGRGQPEIIGDDVIRAYVKVLMEDKNPRLVSYYVAMLPEDDQVDLYADFLQTIVEPGIREEYLKSAEMYGLNVQRITKRVVENIKQLAARGVEIMDDMLTRKTTNTDLVKIAALDWMVYYPEQRAEAIWQVNALIRSFVVEGKLDAARQAFDKIPLGSVEQIMVKYNCTLDSKGAVDTDNLPKRVAAALKEFLCHKAYLDAQEGFSSWFHSYHNTRPSAPVKPGDNAEFTEKVAYEHKEEIYKEELERWQSNMTHQAKAVKSQLYNMIVFPNGWMEDDYDEDEVRKSQLEALRSVCIPQVFMLLHNVLSTMEDYEESIDLAGLIMDEDTMLYKVFSKEQLKELLEKLTETCVSLLSVHGDPFGDFGDDDD